MQYETLACTILFLYQNHQDTPSEIRDLYEFISMPDSQPLSENHFGISIFGFCTVFREWDGGKDR